MKEIIEHLVYRIISKFQSMYWRAWKKEQINKFAECGRNVYVGKNGRFINDHLHIGDNAFIGEQACFIASIAHIYIGNNVTFGPNVTIRGGDHRIDVIGKLINEVTLDEKKPENDADVYIEDDVWIGTNVTILKGVHIGTGSVIGAGSIVIKNVPPYSIHVGCPGIKEKPRFNDEQLSLHLQLLSQHNNCEN